jgi:hypothetical protein
MDSGVYVDMGQSEKVGCRAFSKASLAEFTTAHPQ